MRVRIISAVVAVVLLVGAFLLWKTQGVYGICISGGLGAIFEYSRLEFKKSTAPVYLPPIFILLASLTFLTPLLFADVILISSLVFSMLIFLGITMVPLRRFHHAHDGHPDGIPTAVAQSLKWMSIGSIGFIYVGLFPALVLEIIGFKHGAEWMLGLMAIVFAGDTLAYLAGRAFGRHKLLSPVSPNKTVEGSIGGLIGSGVVGAVMAAYALPEPLNQTSVAVFTLVALVCGLFAQIGDLFESLLKRVADVKDSGSIMPGHGGVLDRIDGLLFAAPVYFVFVRYFLHLA